MWFKNKLFLSNWQKRPLKTERWNHLAACWMFPSPPQTEPTQQVSLKTLFFLFLKPCKGVAVACVHACVTWPPAWPEAAARRCHCSPQPRSPPPSTAWSPDRRTHHHSHLSESFTHLSAGHVVIYLAVLRSLWKRGRGLVRKLGHISPFEHLVIFLGFAELHVDLYSPAAKLLRPPKKLTLKPGHTCQKAPVV